MAVGSSRPPLVGEAATVQIDWEALWLDANGPSISAEDLALVADLHQCLDPDSAGDGIQRPDNIVPLINSFSDLCGGDALEMEEGIAGLLGEDVLDPQEWIAFVSAALCSCGHKQWRKALDELAAVLSISRPFHAEDDDWVIRMGPGGSICCKWFSHVELQPDERLACRALMGASGWRCLSCEAVALDMARSPDIIRVASLPMDSVPTLPEIFGRALTHHPTKSSVRTASKASWPSIRAKYPDLVPSPPREIPSARRCATLEEMLSHRALRPLAKPVRLGDWVMITSIAKCDALKAHHLGASGRVVDLWVPEMSIVKKTWCLLELAKESERLPGSRVAVPLHNTGHLKVSLHPGDAVEAHRPLQAGRRRGERSNETFRGTVLELPPTRPHLVQVSFGPTDTAAVPTHWVLRLEMSAWTQVLRQAPHSTVMFLLSDLQLRPGTPQDMRELEDRLRRDFEPHGRFRYVGVVCDAQDDDTPSLTSPGSRPGSQQANRPVQKRADRFGLQSRACTMNTDSGSVASAVTSKHIRRRGTTRMALGDYGKVLSFDLEALTAEVMPDRKKHLRLRIGLDSLEPDPHVLPMAATAGMHAFDEDPPMLAAAKRNDVRGLRQLLAVVSRRDMMKALLEDVIDPDGNLLFHAAAHAQSVEMWRVVWSALDNGCSAADDVDEAKLRALSAVDDWGRTPLWIALEEGHAKLCSMLLKSKASVNDQAPVLREGETPNHTLHEFCGGPGMIAQGIEFEVTFYRPASSCGIGFGDSRQSRLMNSVHSAKVDGGLVVNRTFGEAADACVMAGDVLLSLGDEPVTSFATLGQLKHRLATEPRPFTLRFRKGNGLFIRPLHRACELGHSETVKVLLEHEADPTWRDVCGRSAMDQAVRAKNRRALSQRAPFERCIETLASAGASEDGQVKVMDAEGRAHPFRFPDHWKLCDEMRLEGRFWLRVQDESSGEVLEHFQRIVDRSMGTSGARKARTQDRRGAIPQKLQVLRVQRVENVASLREYLQRRFILQEAVAHDPVSPLQDCRVKVDYSRLTGKRDSEAALAPELNEAWLFHGTSPQGARGVAHENFLLSLAGSKGGNAFGSGIYFAEDCIKSDEYTGEAPNGDDFAGLRPLLLCRVLLGRMLVSMDRDVSWEISQVMQSKYDSLMADRRAAVGTYREFVVFDENQAYAEYIIWYRRRFS